MNYYFHISGEQIGPLFKSDIEKLIQEGKICKDTLVWKEGMPEWKKMVEIQELSDLVIPRSIILTTSYFIEGYSVTETIDIITSECVFGMNIIKDLLAGISDIFGGRSQTTQNILKDARKACLKELRKEAASVGADAVIAVDLDYSEFSGQGKSMLFLVASGTAVKIKKIEGIAKNSTLQKSDE